ncbi:MAG: substrate-binding domain-containing protein [Clostridiales bacterium]|nr:substrate-binding domain-containing protein [Clostridiales bacterium]
MRKLLSFVLALCLLLTAATAFAEGDQKVIGIIQKNTTDAFHLTINTAAIASLDALKAAGTIDDYRLYDGKTDPITQCDLMEMAINEGCDVIIVLPAEAAGCDPILERGVEAGIPIVVVNSKSNNTDELAATYVGSDDVFAGELMAKFVQEKLPEGGGYAHLMGVIGNSAQIQRTEGIHNILDEDEKWTMLDEQGAEWQGEKAVKFTGDWLQMYGEELNAIICDNDDMSSAVKAYCITEGREDIVCIGVDGNAGPMAMVAAGELDATVFQDGAGQIRKGIEAAVELLEGKEIEKEYMIPFVLITLENVNDYI